MSAGNLVGTVLYFVLFPNVRIKSLIVIVFPFVFFRDVSGSPPSGKTSVESSSGSPFASPVPWGAGR